MVTWWIVAFLTEGPEPQLMPWTLGPTDQCLTLFLSFFLAVFFYVFLYFPHSSLTNPSSFSTPTHSL